MALKDDLTAEVKDVFRSAWDVQTTKGIPDPEDLRLGNHAKDLEEATVLYADLDGSTNMVDSKTWEFSAEVYKTYLRCAARIVASESGVVTAYDGDRIMAIFIGDAKNTQAVRAAMKINYAVNNIINTELKSFYTNTDFVVKHAVGIDCSQLRAARIGVRGYNDLVWIGRAANHAAKLTTIGLDKAIWVTKDVYDTMNEAVRIHKPNTPEAVNMWTKYTWTKMGGAEIYCTTYEYVLA